MELKEIKIPQNLPIEIGSTIEFVGTSGDFTFTAESGVSINDIYNTQEFSYAILKCIDENTYEIIGN